MEKARCFSFSLPRKRFIETVFRPNGDENMTLKIRRFLLLFIIVSFSFSGFIYAQNGDFRSGEFNAYLEFTTPRILQTETEYEFNFTVINTTLAGADVHHWIKEIEVWMPSMDYKIAWSVNPDPVNQFDGHWESEILTDADENTIAINWFFFSENPDNYGDIAEGEILEFEFRAETDAVVTDGFDYKIVADSNDEVSGTAYITTEIDDDDDNNGVNDDFDDDLNANDDGDDDTENDDEPSDEYAVRDSDEEENSSCCCGC
jgi:hypothetical protein